jgi:hypothetical protein
LACGECVLELAEAASDDLIGHRHSIVSASFRWNGADAFFGALASRAFSAEVDAGSAQKTRQIKNLERDPILLNRIAL